MRQMRASSAPLLSVLRAEAYREHATLVVMLLRSVSVAEKVSAEKELISACLDMRWREKQDGMERLLMCLSWWLDTKGENPAALVISGVKNDFAFNRHALEALEHVLSHTDSAEVGDLLKEWDRLLQVEHDAT